MKTITLPVIAAPLFVMASPSASPLEHAPPGTRLPRRGSGPYITGVAARDTDDLRSFVVENLNADADVAGTQTSLIFEHLRGASPL